MVDSGKGKKPMGGCIRSQRGPWIVRRATKKGEVTSFRFPGEKERENNKVRERRRRMITSNIYAGLRAHGGYELPNNVDNNHVLVALCEEAGWHVKEDGSICRKDSNVDGVDNDDETNHDNISPHLCHVQGEDSANLQLSHGHGLSIENMSGDNNVNLALSLYWPSDSFMID